MVAFLMDLKILNKEKDYFVEQMQKERNGFFEQVISANHKVGELEAKLLGLESPVIVASSSISSCFTRKSCHSRKTRRGLPRLGQKEVCETVFNYSLFEGTKSHLKNCLFVTM